MRLQQFEIYVVINNAGDDSTESTNDNSVDLSMLNSVTKLNTNITFVGHLPTSLKWCEIMLASEFDFSALTNLTVLDLWLRSDLRVVFPTQLGTFVIKDGQLGTSNIADVALFRLHSDCDVPLARETLTPPKKRSRKSKGRLSQSCFSSN